MESTGRGNSRCGSHVRRGGSGTSYGWGRKPPTVPAQITVENRQNQVLVDALSERIKRAAERQPRHAFSLIKVIHLVAKHPDALRTEKQLLALNGVGVKTAAFLLASLEKNGILTAPSFGDRSGAIDSRDANTDTKGKGDLVCSTDSRSAHPGLKEFSIPSETSPQWAILCAMYKRPIYGSFSTDEIRTIANTERLAISLERLTELQVSQSLENLLYSKHIFIVEDAEKAAKFGLTSKGKTTGSTIVKNTIHTRSKRSRKEIESVANDWTTQLSGRPLLNNPKQNCSIDLDSDDDCSPNAKRKKNLASMRLCLPGNAIRNALAFKPGVDASAPEQRKPVLKSPTRFVFAPSHGSKTTPQFIRSETTRNASYSSWELVLLIDNREVFNQTSRFSFQHHLASCNVLVETRTLPLGDFLWIFRHKIRKDERVANYIIERKTMEDLSRSIKDGRFAEQKLRLHKCSVPNVIYLTEGATGAQSAIAPKFLEKSLTDIQVCDGFSVRQTSGTPESVKFIANTHKLLESITTHSGSDEWEIQHIGDPTNTYARFCATNGKKKLSTVTEIFGAQIKQVSGCGGAAASAILDRYSTPFSMYKCFYGELASESMETQKLHFADIVPSGHQQRIGKVLSCRLHDIFTR